MFKNIFYVFRITQTNIRWVLLGEFAHGFLLAMPTGMLLLIIWELFKPDPDKTYLWTLILIMLILFAIQMWIGGKIYAITNTAVYRMTSALRIHLGNRLQQLSLGFYKKRDPGDLASVILQDAANFETIFGHALPSIFGAVFGTFFLSLFLFYIDWSLAIMLLLAVPLAFLFVILATIIMKKFSRAQIASRNETGSRFIEYIMGIRHLKAYNQTGEKFSTLRAAFEKLRKKEGWTSMKKNGEKNTKTA